MIYHITRTPGSKEESGIDIVSDDSKKVLVSLSGPMSYFAAGAFILAQQVQDDRCIRVALEAARRT